MFNLVTVGFRARTMHTEAQLEQQAALISSMQHQLESISISEATMQCFAVSVKSQRVGIADLKLRYHGLASRVKANTDATVLLSRLAGEYRGVLQSCSLCSSKHRSRCPPALRVRIMSYPAPKEGIH